MPKSDGKPITLTFDNGPDTEVTPRVLDVLSRHGILSTFFVVGNRMQQHRTAAERAHAEGHWIGNHTWSHSSPFRDRGDAAFVSAEIEPTQTAIGDLAHPDKFFRPYGGKGRLDGALNGVALQHLLRNNYTCILWNSVPGDFIDAQGWPATALCQVDDQEWPLVVLHDIFAEAMGHLDRFVGEIKDRGYVFRQAFPPTTIATLKGQPTPVLAQGVLAN